jgi:hypothetical protein
MFIFYLHTFEIATLLLSKRQQSKFCIINQTHGCFFPGKSTSNNSMRPFNEVR